MLITVVCRPHIRHGFSLVAAVMLMVLIVMILLGVSSLSLIESRAIRQEVHEAAARANARMALMIALGELQKYSGPDQRVTANAAILEGSDSDSVIANRHWLGVWKTSYTHRKQEWPLIGKVNADVENTPYSIKGAYQDLRHSVAELAHGKWRQQHAETWLVSKRNEMIDPRKRLQENSQDVVKLLGRGTLGELMSEDKLTKNQVLVEKVEINGGNTEGAYAWYVSDNNQKACLRAHDQAGNEHLAHEAAPGPNPALVKRDNGDAPYEDYQKQTQAHLDKLISYATLSLTQAKNVSLRRALQNDHHHFTSYSPGLFTNTLMGGLRCDLTPLLLAYPEKAEINLSLADAQPERFFSSSYPIIPGPDHAVLGPSFGALRSWALHKYSDLEYAETNFDQQSTRMRPSEHWAHGMSDGACADASQWAEHAPKVHPVMTECRWHYYFSHHNHRIRTHLVPRVCLWNPYNKSLETAAMSVLMPNPYYGVKHGMHFFPEEEYVDQELKSKGIEVFKRWVKRSGYAGGDVYKIRTNPFPPRRYLAFTLEPTTLSAGQCQVFSPKVRSGPTAGGIRIQEYKLDEVAANLLSAQSIQGTDHFYYDHDPSVAYEIQTPKWQKINPYLGLIDFGKIFDYQPALDLQTDGKVENFPFVLKAGAAGELDELLNSTKHPTLQLINNGAGGVKPTKTFHHIGLYWGSANQKDFSFGNLQTFQEAPVKNAPHTHQIGAKLLWLNEAVGEGDPANRPPHRHGTSSFTRWGTDHMVYNVCPVANWNVRAQLVSRSPASQCANKWYMNSIGPWLLQFVPCRPMDVHDMPAPSTNGFVKHPFGLAVDFAFFPNVVLFDLPSQNYGVISLARLRHAMLSPYSWNPTYLVGHSLRDLHAPAEASAFAVATEDFSKKQAPTRWDYLLGHAVGSNQAHGARCTLSDSQGLLQIGDQSITRKAGEMKFSSAEEVLAYDIAYEVNHNLWDSYFLSSLPMDTAGELFIWDPRDGTHLHNRGYQFNEDSRQSVSMIVEMLHSDQGASEAFWKSAAFLKNRSAFNVNSISVEAWTAFLSATLGISRSLSEGSSSKDGVSYARYYKPSGVADTLAARPDQPGGWMGARQLSGDEVRLLAHQIVEEVKSRGPFVSIADFVNRRLASDQNPTSQMGVIDAAIESCGLNRNFERSPQDLSTSVNTATNSDAPDNNMSAFKNGYRYRVGNKWHSAQPKSKAWGMPGFLTQGDILTPLAPFMSVRGDTFTIRAYGESSEKGVIMSRAWLEATIERTPHYLEHDASPVRQLHGNRPYDSVLTIDRATGKHERGNLTAANEKFGRKYKLKTFRWLRQEEI